LVLPGDYGAGIAANGQLLIVTHKIAIEFNYHRNKGGRVYSLSCCVTHLSEVPNSHKDVGNKLSRRDYASGNESLVGKLRSASKIIDSDEWT
jgi:hypothetical protein